MIHTVGFHRMPKRTGMVNVCPSKEKIPAVLLLLANNGYGGARESCLYHCVPYRFSRRLICSCLVVSLVRMYPILMAFLSVEWYNFTFAGRLGEYCCHWWWDFFFSLTGATFVQLEVEIKRQNDLTASGECWGNQICWGLCSRWKLTLSLVGCNKGHKELL